MMFFHNRADVKIQSVGNDFHIHPFFLRQTIKFCKEGIIFACFKT